MILRFNRIFTPKEYFPVVKAKRLKHTPETEFYLIAIASSEDAYRLSWVINDILDIQLKRADPLKIWEENKENPGKYICYAYISEEQQGVCRLISNKSESGLLEPKLKQFDFFLQFQHLPGVKPESVVNALKKHNDILLAMEI
ncbi:MAG: IPExxxVDY family protein, partial [Bacteroidota bacterium]